MATPRKSPADDARHPDTTADQDLARRAGFHAIEPVDPQEGPGVVEPVRAEAVNAAGENSTFASRAAARGGNKAVQPSQTESKQPDGSGS